MNSCNKYHDWLTEAAIGELNPRQERELLAHAAECEACREAYSEAREANALADAIDLGVESLVSGEPSSHFNSRLRARIAAEAVSPRSAWRTWAPVAAMAAALAVVLTVFVLHTRRTVPVIPTNTEVAVNSTVPPGSANPPSDVSPAYTDSRATNAPVPVAHHRSHPAHVWPSEPGVLVEPGQLHAAMQLSDAIHSGRVDGKELVAAQDQLKAPLEIKPIEIAPFSSLDADVITDASRNSSQP